MAFKRTKKWPTAQKLAKTLDSVGAVYNAYTDKERTVYWIKIAPQYLELALEIISQMLNKALLKQEEINVERGVIIEEINMYEDRPMDKVDDLFEEQLLGNNPLGRPLIGYKEAILKMDREDFVNFKSRWYKAKEMSLAVVGAVGNLAKSQDLVKKYFAETRPGEAKEVVVKVASRRKKILIQRQKTQQTHFVVGIPTVALPDREKWPARILAAVLGQGMSSRLWRQIREKRGWAYYVYAFHREYLPAGYLAVKAGVKNEAAKEAILLVQKELEQIASSLRPAEVARAKRMMAGQFLIGMEDPFNLASLLNKGWLFEGQIMTPEKITKTIESVDFSQTRQFARQFVDLDRLRGAIIGPGR
jgi:predicted Zn-dependent peptidase